MDGWIQKNRAKHQSIFALADDVNDLCHTSMFELEPHSRVIHEMLASTLYLRVVSNYQGTVLLLERGMMSESRVLARAMLEAIFSLVAIGNDPSLAYDYVYEDRNSRLKFLQKFMELHHGKLPEGSSETEIQKLEKELKDDIVSNPRKVRTTKEWAQEADLLSWYLTAYPLLSMSVHSKVRDLEQYLILDDKGEIKEFKWGPDDTGVEIVLFTIIEGLLISLKSVLGVFKKDKNEQIDCLRGRLTTFVGK